MPRMFGRHVVSKERGVRLFGNSITETGFLHLNGNIFQFSCADRLQMDKITNIEGYGLILDALGLK